MKIPGPWWIALAALLWASDSLWRVSSLKLIDPVSLVFWEHLLALALLVPFLVPGSVRSALASLSRAQWLGTAFIGLGGSALATICFTAAYRSVDPSVVVLLQKFQPIVAILLAALFLGERPRASFFGWSALALVAGVVLSAPELGARPFSREFWLAIRDSRGMHYALAAATLWGAGTVVGKRLLGNLPVTVITFWRFAFGALGILLFLAFVSPGEVFAERGLAGALLAVRDEPAVLKPLLLMALLPGMVSMLSYYRGLRETPARVATVIEGIFPVAAIALNFAFLGSTLTPLQLGAGALLIFAVTRIALGEA